MALFDTAIIVDDTPTDLKLLIVRDKSALVVESFVRADQLALAVWHTVLEFALVISATFDGEFTLAMALSILELTNIDITVLVSLSGMTIRQAIGP